VPVLKEAKPLVFTVIPTLARWLSWTTLFGLMWLSRVVSTAWPAELKVTELKDMVLLVVAACVPLDRRAAGDSCGV
jgi:hypothetical protein